MYNNVMAIPKHTRETLQNYLRRGWEPGGFVTSMLAMDMQRALTTADLANRERMWQIGQWIMNIAPEQAWGSYQAVTDWCADLDQRRTKWAAWATLATEPEVEKDLNF